MLAAGMAVTRCCAHLVPHAEPVLVCQRIPFCKEVLKDHPAALDGRHVGCDVAQLGERWSGHAQCLALLGATEQGFLGGKNA